MAIKSEIVNVLLKDINQKKDFSEALLVDIKTALTEWMLNTEMDQYLGGDVAAAGSNGEVNTNYRNGHIKKPVITDTRQVSAYPLEVRRMIYTTTI